ncbi:DUF5666 domain-containing protein [Streptomyces sp. WMMC500]|uniref:DUF5666 domain-containing protein n=1 Tax=Streptomyces sp. WMMC500 TaxID=3015154 RepID=UPI00248BFCB7|nr:DUF5666 domain-containing protein [Streptomyces sp. WMMC500]WBB62380.1 DUF5666 domain-containing protein [Streptomyces sp. WMMC500]
MKRSLAVTGGVFACSTVIAVGATAYGLSGESGGSPLSGTSQAQPAADAASDDEGREPKRFLDELPGLKDLDPGELADKELLHSESAVEDRETGEITYRAGQVGEVTAASDSALTVKSSDGVSWKWTLDDDTRIRVEDDADADASAVEVGDEVAVSGTRDGDARTAEHVLDPPPDPEKIRKEIEEGVDELPGKLPELREKVPGELKEKLPDSLRESLGEGRPASPA